LGNVAGNRHWFAAPDVSFKMRPSRLSPRRGSSSPSPGQRPGERGSQRLASGQRPNRSVGERLARWAETRSCCSNLPRALPGAGRTTGPSARKTRPPYCWSGRVGGNFRSRADSASGSRQVRERNSHEFRSNPRHRREFWQIPLHLASNPGSSTPLDVKTLFFGF
jgi:hypothetical protein